MIDIIGNNLAAIFIFLAGMCLLVIVMLQSLQISRMKQRIDMLTGGAEGDLEAVLGQHLETVHEVGQDLDELTARMAVLESSGRHHYARQGLVRFSPFEDTGGNQSFALALLDESDDGLIISSLHSRTGTRIYAKVVTNGKPDSTTSPEETQAIDEARDRRGAGAVTDNVAEPKPGAGARVAPASARVTPASFRADPVPLVPAVTVQEITERPATERVQGQVKSRVLDQPGAESEMAGRKPGRQPAPEAVEQADKPSS